MAHYLVKNWENFQHYKDRNPPWIKLHYELMTSRSWLKLDDAGKLLAVVCMMIASRDQGKIPDDSDYIQAVAHLKKSPDFKPLINCGFLTYVANASMEQADASECYNREETEKRREEKEDSIEYPPFLNEWIKYRREIKQPLSKQTIEANLKKLNDWQSQGYDPSAIVQESISNGWKGLFEPKNKPKKENWLGPSFPSAAGG